MAKDPGHILIFEPNPRGHPLEWARHIVAEYGRDDRGVALTFAVAAELAAALEGDGPLPPGAALLRLEAGEQAGCVDARLAVSALARWRAMRRCLRASGAGHGLFLEFDHLSLPFGLGLGMAGRRVSGVLFRPSLHYRAFAGAPPTPGERLRELRKRLLYAGMLRNPAVAGVFTLDPYFPRWAARHLRGGDKVRALVDPAHPPVAPSCADEARLAACVPAGRTCFLLFGVLSERKGVLKLIEALATLAPAVASRAAVMLAGSVDPAIAATVRQRVEQLKATRPELWIALEDRRLAPGELSALVARADVVLAPYQRFVGSSGLLLWAARAGRPVIAQAYGLVGRLVREHRLGVTVDCGDAGALGAAIAAATAAPGSLHDPASAEAFAALRSPTRFAATLLHGLADGARDGAAAALPGGAGRLAR